MTEHEEPEFPTDKFVAFEEFDLYFQTTVTTTEQRLSSNRWNYSVCVALIVGVAFLIKFSSENAPYVLFSIVGIIALCALAAIFCNLWLKQISVLKALNGHKFAVLEEMAPRLEFEEGDSGSCQSYEPFKREWLRAKEAKDATRVRALNGKTALKGSDAELFMPKAFMAVFIGLGTLVLLSSLISTVAPGLRQYVPFSISPPTSSPAPEQPQSPTGASTPSPTGTR